MATAPAQLDLATDDSAASARLQLTMPEFYRRRVRARAVERGISESEAVRQMMDEADQKTLGHFKTVINGKLNAVTMAAATIRLATNKSNSEVLAMLKVIDESAREVAGMLSGVTAV